MHQHTTRSPEGTGARLHPAGLTKYRPGQGRGALRALVLDRTHQELDQDRWCSSAPSWTDEIPARARPRSPEGTGARPHPAGATHGSASGAALDQELRWIWSCVRSKSRSSSTRRTEGLETTTGPPQLYNEIAWKPMREHYHQPLIFAKHHWGA